MSSRTAILSGSSPLARGTLTVVACSGAAIRFIPAGAGNTFAPAARIGRAAVHPRWRGEHDHQQPVTNAGLGSSPLARGTHVQPVDGEVERRFIPAGAGNT